MPATFHSSGFEFALGDIVPEHIEDWPLAEARDASLYWIQGRDAFSDEYYLVATNIETLAQAALLHAARLRHIEQNQPKDEAGSIQDQTYIRKPQNNGQN